VVLPLTQLQNFLLRKCLQPCDSASFIAVVKCSVFIDLRCAESVCLYYGLVCLPEVITEPERRSGLRKESTIFSEARAEPRVGFLNENRIRSWNSSENFSFYRSRIINFIKLKFSLNEKLLDQYNRYIILDKFVTH